MRLRRRDPAGFISTIIDQAGGPLGEGKNVRLPASELLPASSVQVLRTFPVRGGLLYRKMSIDSVWEPHCRCLSDIDTYCASGPPPRCSAHGRWLFRKIAIATRSPLMR